MNIIINSENLITTAKEIVKSGYIQTLIIVIIVDVISGYINSYINRIMDSSVGIKGLLKHILVIFVSLIMTEYLILFSYKQFAYSFVIYLIINYILSIIENWSQIGLPLPAFIKDHFLRLKKDTLKPEDLKKKDD